MICNRFSIWKTARKSSVNTFGLVFETTFPYFLKVLPKFLYFEIFLLCMITITIHSQLCFRILINLCVEMNIMQCKFVCEWFEFEQKISFQISLSLIWLCNYIFITLYLLALFRAFFFHCIIFNSLVNLHMFNFKYNEEIKWHSIEQES